MKIAKDKGLLIHSQNSGGIIYHGDFGGDIVRAGVILYGHYPNYPLEVPFDMKSVMTVKSVVSQLKTIPAGTQKNLLYADKLRQNIYRRKGNDGRRYTDRIR